MPCCLGDPWPRRPKNYEPEWQRKERRRREFQKARDDESRRRASTPKS